MGDAVCRHPYGFIDMHIALGHAARSVTEQGGDGQLHKAEVGRDAGKRVAQRMRRDALQTRAVAHTRFSTPTAAVK